MTTQIEIEGQTIPFTLDLGNWDWHSSAEMRESDFPLITSVDGRRYELYSDETFAEVETE
jgi:hypothetical protein